MIKNFNVLAIIPARGGSKRIPGKNIKELRGKPLVAYTFEAANNSKYIDRSILSSDDNKLIEVAKSFGIDVPFVRPHELAEDLTPDFPVFLHALEWLDRNEGYRPEIIIQLRPTSPLRQTSHIDMAIELLANHPEADSVRTVTEPEQSPYKMYSMENGYLTPLLKVKGKKESFNLPSQQLPSAYKHIGYVDAMWRSTIVQKRQMTGDKILGLIIKDGISGINTTKDWELTEFLIGKNKL